MQKPIAIAQLGNGNTVEFYYQYQAIPPQGLFSEKYDRPEILVLLRTSEGDTHNLLAVEVKADQKFKIQEMKGAISSLLLEWNVKSALGINYFPMGAAKALSSMNSKAGKLVGVEDCKPHSSVVEELNNWLIRFWHDEIAYLIRLN